MASDLKHVIVVGGGASATLLAAHLLKDGTPDLRITIIEKAPKVGLGLAYGTGNRDHLLNVRAYNMSAFPDRPDHFWSWLGETGLSAELRCESSFSFIPRQVYGRYLCSLLEREQGLPEADKRLHVAQGECISMQVTPSGVIATLADGTSHVGHHAVLATGNEMSPPSSLPYITDPWTVADVVGGRRQGDIFILGTGLTMIDCALSLLRSGHQGRIIAMSRRGLLPRIHQHTTPLQIEETDIPFGADIPYMLRWFRRLAAQSAACGGDWTSVVDGVRPYTQQLWRRLPMPAKHRFLRHARTWWDVHRHRMAPEIGVQINDAIARGQLAVMSGKISAIQPTADGAQVTYRPRGAADEVAIDVMTVVPCTGVLTNLAETRNPVLQSLLRQKIARPDPLRLGIDVTDDCALIDQGGEVSRRVFAVGPLTRGTFWETIAVPDIRTQVARLARQILADDAVPCTAASENAASSQREKASV